MGTYLEKLEAYVKRASEKVAEIRCEDSLVFPVFTDLHTKDAELAAKLDAKRAKDTAAVLAKDAALQEKLRGLDA